jgi:hypothetical protein
MTIYVMTTSVSDDLQALPAVGPRSSILTKYVCLGIVTARREARRSDRRLLRDSPEAKQASLARPPPASASVLTRSRLRLHSQRGHRIDRNINALCGAPLREHSTSRRRRRLREPTVAAGARRQRSARRRRLQAYLAYLKSHRQR